MSYKCPNFWPNKEKVKNEDYYKNSGRGKMRAEEALRLIECKAEETSEALITFLEV
jgi:hypothetical protein